MNKQTQNETTKTYGHMNTKPTIKDIENATKEFALARQRLAGLVAELNDQIEQLKRARHAALQRATAELAQHHGHLKSLIAAAPQCFTRPRTAVFHGIKVGYQKGKGCIEFADSDRVVALIHRHYEDEAAEALLHIIERPDKEALAKLSVAELRKLGCTVVESDDQIVIRSADHDVDKTITTLLRGASEVLELKAAA